MNEIIDGKHYPGQCSNCGREIDGSGWFYIANGGSVWLTFCQDHKPEPGCFDSVTEATSVELTDDKTGQQFQRVIDISEWF